MELKFQCLYVKSYLNPEMLFTYGLQMILCYYSKAKWWHLIVCKELNIYQLLLSILIGGTNYYHPSCSLGHDICFGFLSCFGRRDLQKLLLGLTHKPLTLAKNPLQGVWQFPSMSISITHSETVKMDHCPSPCKLALTRIPFITCPFISQLKQGCHITFPVSMYQRQQESSKCFVISLSPVQLPN